MQKQKNQKQIVYADVMERCGIWKFAGKNAKLQSIDLKEDSNKKLEMCIRDRPTYIYPPLPVEPFMGSCP